MKNYIFVFAARSESISFGNLLRSRGIGSTIITTPRECMTGCGLSVKINEIDLMRAKFCLNNTRNIQSFKGIYSLEKVGIRNIVNMVK